MFSDAFLETKSSNLQILTELVKWTFQSKAVLRATNFQHNRLGEYTQHGIYRIKDKMQVSIKVQEFSDGKWSDFITDDLQFNAIMLDPYVRKTMICKNGTYSVDWQLPDVYGVFTFSINYKRHGLSWIEAKDIVQVRPFRHDDYERFIFSAWPYYINVGSMIVAFLVVSSVWVFDRDVVKKEE